MSLILGPNYDVAYPVNFYSGGDTTRDAFLKHIQEIERIYGALTALDAGKASSTEITSAINNAINNLDLSNLSGSIDGSKISGNIDASKIIGELTNATISANNVITDSQTRLNYGERTVQGALTLIFSKIDNLDDLYNSLNGGGSTSDKGDGITESQLNANGGYIKFNNGLIAQWGKGSTGTSQFTKAFSSACYVLFVHPIYKNTPNTICFYDTGGADQISFSVSSCSTTGFTCSMYDGNSGSSGSNVSSGVNYFAIGV